MYREGSVIENAVDLRIDSPLAPIELSRTYRTLVAVNELSPAKSSTMGSRWFDVNRDIFLEANPAVGSDDGWSSARYLLHFSVVEAIPIYLRSNGKLEAAADWDLDIAKDTENHELVVYHRPSRRWYVLNLPDDNAVPASQRGRIKRLELASPCGEGTSVTYTYPICTQDPKTGPNCYVTTVTITTAPPLCDPNDPNQTTSCNEGVIESRTVQYEYVKVGSFWLTKMAKIQGSIPKGSTPAPVHYAKYSYVGQSQSTGYVAVPYYQQLGEYGDLAQVAVVKNDSAGQPVTRYTQYRYYRKSVAGYGGILKAVYENDAIQQIMADGGLTYPEQIYYLADDDEVGSTGRTVSDYASRSFVYSFDTTAYPNINTANVNTVWKANENLQLDYVDDPDDDYNWNEAHELRTHIEHLGGTAGCSSCGGAPQGRITKKYYYVGIKQGFYNYYDLWNVFRGFSHANHINEVTQLIIEDTITYEDGDPNSPVPLYRTIYGVNDYGRKLREVRIEDPTATTLRCWCQAWVFCDYDMNGDADGDDAGDRPLLKHRLAEYRPPSAYTVTSLEDLQKFLDPFDDDDSNMTGEASSGKDGSSAGWANDESVLNDDDGEITVYGYFGDPNDSYDDHPDGRQRDVWVKRGSEGTKYYVSAQDWYEEGSGATWRSHRHLTAEYTFPEKTTVRADGVKTTHEYTFWNDDARFLKTKTTTLPAIPIAQNGADSGSGDDATVREEYYDQFGQLRWTKDGEGYVNYYSYSPGAGGDAYTAIDIEPALDEEDELQLPESAVDGIPRRWVPPCFGGAHENRPEGRGWNEEELPAPLTLVTTQEFDVLGRPSLQTEPDGSQHYTVYDGNRVIQVPYWDGTAAQLPIQVVELDNSDRISATYSLPPTFELTTVGTSPNVLPTKLDSAPTSSDYVSLTRYFYDGGMGQPEEVQVYHDASGTEEFDDYTSTWHFYDQENHRGMTVVGVADDRFQVDVTVLDGLGRAVEFRRGVHTQLPSEDYAELAGSSPPSWLKTISTTEYDGNGVGDSRVTKRRQYHTATTYTDTTYFRTFRGFLRGTKREYTAGSTSPVTPFEVQDVDWQGRVIAAAQYTTEPSDWGDLTEDEGDSAYANGSGTSGRHDLTLTHYDNLGRVFRTDRYPGAEDEDHFEVNNYYDRNNNLACTGDKYSVHTETAFDGAGRQYQMRTVLDVADTPYDGGKFQYRAPAPAPDVSEMTGGHDGLIEFSHTVYNDSGSPIAEHAFELNHDDPNGVDMATPNYVRRSVYSWYDAMERLRTVADYGAGDGTGSGAGSWEYTNLADPNDVSEPGASSDAALVIKYAYDESTGRLVLVIDPAGIQTKTFYDDAGRRIAVAENYDDFVPPTSGIGGGDEDRVTAWEYNGLGQVVTLTAYNGSSEDEQVTAYRYVDDIDAGLVTKTVYPDGDEADDNVRQTYNLDGSLATLTDQRGVVHTYTHNSRRQVIADQVTDFGSVDPNQSFGAITRKYDALGRLTHLTSHASSTDDPNGPAANQVKVSYNTQGLVSQSQQAHAGGVDPNSPSVEYDYDSLVETDDAFHNGLRLKTVTYPLVAGDARVEYGYEGYANDRLNRVNSHQLYDGELSESSVIVASYYEYSGTGRLVKTSVLGNQLRTQREMFSAAGVYSGWDRWGRVAQNKWKTAGGAAQDQQDYTYDYAGNRLTRNVAASTNDTRDQQYGYDGLHRLSNYDQGTWSGSAISGSNRQRYWLLDHLGNWAELYEGLTSGGTLLEERAHNEANELTNFTSPNTWVNPQHDEAGNMTAVPQPSDPNQPYELTWDAWNRPVAMKDGVTVVQVNAYDGLNRRVIRDESGGSGDLKHFYYNEQWQVLAEADPNNSVTAIYSYHPHYIDAVAARYTASGPHIYLQDDNYNVTAVIQEDTGEVVERYSYSPYGEVSVLEPDFSADPNGTDVGNEILYTGRRLDPETGLQINRNRFYAAHLGGWLSRDPIGYDAQLWNLYNYVSSNPLNLLDPSGLDTEKSCLQKCRDEQLELYRWAEDARDDCLQYSSITRPGRPRWVCYTEYRRRIVAINLRFLACALLCPDCIIIAK